MDASRNSNLGDWFRSLIQSLKGIKEGFNSTTGQYGGGGIDEVNNKLEAVKTKLDTLNVSVKLDDPDIAATKANTDTIVSNITAIKTNSDTTKADVGTIKTDLATVKSDLATVKTNTADTKTSVDTVNTTVTNIYTLLDDRLVKKLWITRADYDQLVLDDEVDPETLYIVIESQSNS